MAAETSWHRCGTKLRHCHPIRMASDFCQGQQYWKVMRAVRRNELVVAFAALSDDATVVNASYV